MATGSRSHPDPGTQASPTVTAPTAPTVIARQVGWLSAHRWETSIGSGEWPVRPRAAISKAITVRSSALLKRPPLDVVLDSPFVAADYAEQISHGSPGSASVSMALTLHGSASCSWIVPYFLFGQRLLRLTPPRTFICEPTGYSGLLRPLIASSRSVASGMHPEATQCFSAAAPTCSQAWLSSGPEDDICHPGGRSCLDRLPCCLARTPDRRRPLEQPPPPDLALQP